MKKMFGIDMSFLLLCVLFRFAIGIKWCVLVMLGYVCVNAVVVAMEAVTRRRLRSSDIDYDRVENDIVSAWFVVKNAWAQGNITLPRNYMTQEFFEKCQDKQDKMQRLNRQNPRKDIDISSIRPVCFSAKGCGVMCVRVEGKMVEYISGVSTNRIFGIWAGIRNMLINFSFNRNKIR